jgi:uncharacterized protein (TIGR03435 family)
MTIKTVIVLAAALAAGAQPRFEVASVKPSAAGCANVGRGAGGGRPEVTPARLDLACRTTLSLIELAYSVPVSGGPAWIGTERYDIDAKAEGAPGQESMRGPMLQALLEDRFQLKIHRESRDVPAFVLAVGRGGPKRLQPAQEGKCITHGPGMQRPEEGQHLCGLFYPSAGKGESDVYGVSMGDLCRQFALLAHQECVDKTGIAGKFDIHFDAGDGVPDAQLDGLIYTVAEQLGLKLEQGKTPSQFVIVDRVERPSGN